MQITLLGYGFIANVTPVSMTRQFVYIGSDYYRSLFLLALYLHMVPPRTSGPIIEQLSKDVQYQHQIMQDGASHNEQVPDKM